ncbi:MULTISPECIES: LpqB family beta-propeller domain-containing protein [Nocardioides]|uniref:LpqB family beta-propeller domain-containing protein n=1 Tax=Nocardioides vastitatis TaxID=2568655 RepID=A0ABW0ZFC0_9ACTN|nr:LpqB family beta-propeller domain-containing protein [Nocardioides sp.]THI91269.1 hypothetical protein E7Z54_22385 [Nocardioides sp.]
MTRLVALLIALLAATTLAGCMDLPDEGPVVESGVTEERDGRRASGIDARPPADGASRTQVVTGFLDAMTAWPIQTSVAKEYLTEEAAEQWNPERETIVYGDSLPAREVGGEVTVQLTDADGLDSIGSWRGPLPESELTLQFQVTVEDGEYRIFQPPDALVVPASWFQQRYRQVSLYYFDPVAQILVPEPVFVPVGDQLATTLVSALLDGPPPRASGVVRTFIPAGLSVGLSVPVDDEGVADITLVGDAPLVSPEEAELMLAQLAWTLKQDTAITAVRVTIGDADLPLPGGASTYSVDSAQDFAPSGAGATTLLFALSGGRLLWGSNDSLLPVTGPFGGLGLGIVSVAARPDGELVAAVDRDGTRVRVAPVRDVPEGARPQTVLSGGTRFARPTWDDAGRLWLLDRRRGGAVVWLVEDGVAREVRVRGVTGERAHQLIASRDGTRLVSVVRTSEGDEVLGARVVIGSSGRVARVREPFVIRPAEDTRIVDVAWTSPIRVALLTPTSPRTLYEVDIVAADGAAVAIDTLSTIVAGPVLGIAGTPTPEAPTFAVFGDHYLDVVTQEQYDTGPAPISQLDYAG